MPETNGTTDEDTPAAKHDGHANEIPDLSVGDRVRIKTTGYTNKPRTLTVESHTTDAECPSIFAKEPADGYKLTGYGTEYDLIQTVTPNWATIDLMYDSAPLGESVTEIEVVERAETTG